jgi:hypothetical protein
MALETRSRSTWRRHTSMSLELLAGRVTAKPPGLGCAESVHTTVTSGSQVGQEGYFCERNPGRYWRRAGGHCVPPISSGLLSQWKSTVPAG